MWKVAGKSSGTSCTAVRLGVKLIRWEKVTVVKEGKAGAWNAHIGYYFTNQELRKQLDGRACD